MKRKGKNLLRKRISALIWPNNFLHSDFVIFQRFLLCYREISLSTLCYSPPSICTVVFFEREKIRFILYLVVSQQVDGLRLLLLLLK